MSEDLCPKCGWARHIKIPGCTHVWTAWDNFLCWWAVAVILFSAWGLMFRPSWLAPPPGTSIRAVFP